MRSNTTIEMRSVWNEKKNDFIHGWYKEIVVGCHHKYMFSHNVVVVSSWRLLLLLFNDRSESLWNCCCGLGIVWHLFESFYRFLIVQGGFAVVRILLCLIARANQAISYIMKGAWIGLEIDLLKSRIKVSVFLFYGISTFISYLILKPS